MVRAHTFMHKYLLCLLLLRRRVIAARKIWKCLQRYFALERLSPTQHSPSLEESIVREVNAIRWIFMYCKIRVTSAYATGSGAPQVIEAMRVK